MPLTLTGRKVTLDNNEHPSLVDIAVGLSRQPRWSGQGRRWFSVLDHTLFGDELVQESDEYQLRQARLAWLLHDAHEALTGDIPTPFKAQEMRALQQGLDVRIAAAYFPGGPAAWASWSTFVKEIDARTMRAEAMWVGPQAAEHHPSAFGIDGGNADEVRQDSDVLRRQLSKGLLGIPPVHPDQAPESHPTVKEYLRRVMELL
jgi:hypothetical protein